MNAMFTAFLNSLPLVKGERDYIVMLIDQAVKRMPAPLTTEEEEAAKAEAEAREKMALETARAKEAREAEIAVKEAESDRVLADAAAKTAAENEAAAKSAAGGNHKAKKHATA